MKTPSNNRQKLLWLTALRAKTSRHILYRIPTELLYDHILSCLAMWQILTKVSLVARSFWYTTTDSFSIYSTNSATIPRLLYYWCVRCLQTRPLCRCSSCMQSIYVCCELCLHVMWTLLYRLTFYIFLVQKRINPIYHQTRSMVFKDSIW